MGILVETNSYVALHTYVYAVHANLKIYYANGISIQHHICLLHLLVKIPGCDLNPKHLFMKSMNMPHHK